jgi:hypothetical protein
MALHLKLNLAMPAAGYAYALAALMNLSVYAQSKLWCHILSQHPLIQYGQW